MIHFLRWIFSGYIILNLIGIYDRVAGAVVIILLRETAAVVMGAEMTAEEETATTEEAETTADPHTEAAIPALPAETALDRAKENGKYFTTSF